MIKGRSETVSRDFWSEQGSEKEILKVTDEKKQRLCSEYRKAQSRLAARGRRDRESQLFSELAALLPLPLDMGAQLDKASVIRLTVGYFRLRTLLDPVDHCSPDHSIDIAGFYDVPTGPMHPFTSVATDKELSSDDMFSEEKLLDSALGGFLLLISLNGQIIFTTKDVNKYLGTNQLDLIGRSFFDFIHPCDQKEVKEILTKLIGDEEQQKCSMILRIKSAINQRMASWKVLHFAGVRKPSLPQGSSCLVLLCRPLPIHDISRMCTGLGFKTFLSMHSPDMKFTYCNSRVLEATGFTDTDLFGQSVYNYYHASDSHCMLQAHRCLLSKGQMTTGKYRFLHKHGGYVWTETEASVVYNIQTGQPQCVFCINYVLSDVESSEVVFSLEQREGFQKPHVICPQALADITFQKGNEAPAAIPDSITPLSELFKDLEVPASFFCELYDMDLDTLAPYIPMDGEDFLLTPLLEDLMERQQTSQRNALQDNSTLFRHSEVPNHVGTVLPASRYYRSTAPLETWSDCRAFPQCTHTPRIFQKQFKNSRQSQNLPAKNRGMKFLLTVKPMTYIMPWSTGGRFKEGGGIWRKYHISTQYSR
ncbi:hypoxia inducible factor 1 subunit alpha, like 2 isoform X2 [Denticeps clupeoides]|uniref:hypoxia inducible factor 1 subunit alpha, like 2 isoform X2 n=1 Tax=Denticeps clupeoides TaxID=299321 RepID=UPI0010A59505|nr:hypoxia-inducible factor 1-alpha-like isoform X2 [Denticeps clupeoides]